MNSKIDSDLDLNDKPVSLKSVLENDLKKLNAVYGEDHLNIDKSVHTIRKSLKSISAILLLCEIHFEREQYLILKTYIKSLSKKYGVVREPYVYLQTFNQVKEKLKECDSNYLDELKNNLELQYNLNLSDVKNKLETFDSREESILILTEELKNLDKDFKYKPLKRRLLISFQKSRKLYRKLNLGSSACEYHRFRKWCKIFYHQQTMINRIGSAKKNKKNKKLYKLTEFLGKEHDLQMFCNYLSTHYPEISQFSKSLFRLKINKLRKKALRLYPKIVY